MTTSVAPRRAYVWAWLPVANDPVVAGVLEETSKRLSDEAVYSFTYGRSYRARPDAIALYTPELPLREGTFDPDDPLPTSEREPLPLAGCLRDAAPDSWGRRVINTRLAGDASADLGELTYLLSGGSDRIGALDFQTSSDEYMPRADSDVPLSALMEFSDRVTAGEEVPPELEAAAAHGTSIGGARPKALLTDGDRHLIAKFSSTTDDRPVVEAEAVAMLLAKDAGLSVAPVEVVTVDGRQVLLVERFDRGPRNSRRLMISALTILGFSEMSAHHASYPLICQSIRTSFSKPGATLEELFGRLVLNVCVGNTDDHLRNHAAFWNGKELSLTPAYDVAPQRRSGQYANQAIAITERGVRASQLESCRAAAAAFLLTPLQAEAVIYRVVTAVNTGWPDACDRAKLTQTQRRQLWGREFMNPFIFEH
ncbi:MAG: hypothetical protein JWR83_1868 [Aeromicrobium sp.]|nr:hypothetical protein [Aeromicrobium sp.]